MSLGDGALHMPYEESPTPGELDLSTALISAGVVVMGAVVPLEGGRTAPGLVFRFALAEGGFMPPVLLAQAPAELISLGKLVADATSSAIRNAAAGR